MKPSVGEGRIQLENDATVAIIGGGPGGTFLAIHLLRRARELHRRINVTLFEQQGPCDATGAGCVAGSWKGCNCCAGGISPRLKEVLADLDLHLPSELIQRRIHAITIQGDWKNIELRAPEGREILSVYRGTRPVKRLDRVHSLDSFLLEAAVKAGARLITGEVIDAHRADNGRVSVGYRAEGSERTQESDLVVFATGVNRMNGAAGNGSPMLRAMRGLLPGFTLPRLRRAIIFELEGKPRIPATLSETLHFVEYGSRTLPLEMCSLVPKREFVTAVLVGKRVDRAEGWEENRRIMRQFLELPHIRKLMPPGTDLIPSCVCNPSLVVGAARKPFGDRVTVVGDLATARLYKDGILSAQQTARALAETVLTDGVDARSLKRGYEPTLKRFRQDNRFARIVFLLHRLFFASSVLSRVLYQAVITERKRTPVDQRRLEQMLWRVVSGDGEYRRIFLSMIHPATMGSVLIGGVLVTLRNYMAELLFGLHWEGFGRFTTGVPLERLETKRLEFARLMVHEHVAVPERLEFERMYTINIRAPRHRILAELGRFGEADRGYLRPHWVRIRRTRGRPNAPGCVITYEVVSRHLAFSLELDQLKNRRLAVYRVRDGFAKGGVLIFEIEERNPETCALSIYVAFNFARGRTWATRPLYSLLRWLFPAYIHDVIWNHSLCQLKDIVEAGGGEAVTHRPTVGCEAGCECAATSPT